MSGTYHVGGLVGRNEATITQAYATGTVTGADAVAGLVGVNDGGAITQAYSTGAVSGTNHAGGLVGVHNGGTITQAYATGAVVGVLNVGGLVGLQRLSGTITNAHATGAVQGRAYVGGLVGGLVGGQGSGTITQAYATGAVSGSAEVGGLVGRNDGTISASFWDIGTTGRPNGVGSGSGAGATGLTTAGARSQAGYTGWNFTTDWFQADDMRPIGRWEAAQPGTDGVRVIRNLNQLQLMAANLGASYRLGADINAAPTNATVANPGIWGAGGFVPIGSEPLGGTDRARFTGSLDGAGRVITGLTINRPDRNNVGLFGAIGGSAIISKIGLQGGAVTGYDAVGGLVGLHVSGTISEAYASSAVSGQNYVGGLVGLHVNGTIMQAYATGSVSGVSEVGGLVGRNQSAITHAYATGRVTGSSEVGGLVGSNAGAISASFFDTVTTRPAGSNVALPGVGAGSGTGVTGRTTDDLQDIATFRTTYAGWDFDTVWAPPNRLGQNSNATSAFYPELYSLSNVVGVFAPSASRPYGEANPTLTARYRGLRPGDMIATPATITFAGPPPTATSPAGTTHALTASGTTVNSLTGGTYRTVHVSGTLTITPRPITVTADPQSRFFGEANPPLSYRIGGLGLVGSDTLIGGLTTEATAASGAGAYPITQGSLRTTNSANYAITFIGNTLTITPRPASLDSNPALIFVPPSAADSPSRVARDQMTGRIETNLTATSGFRTVRLSGSGEMNMMEPTLLDTILCLGNDRGVCTIILPQPP